jgi:hypothetical protein
MPIQIQYRRGTAAQWTAANTLLAAGEPGYETDTGKFKVGNGSTSWNSLAYASGIQGTVGPSGSGGVPYAFSTTTTDSDPGNGIIRYNSGTMSSVSFIYIDNLDSLGNTQTGWYDTWDDSTTTATRGTIYLLGTSVGSTTFNVFTVTGAVTPTGGATGYYKIPVSYVSGSLPTNTGSLSVVFSRTGDQGIQGTTGTQGSTGTQGTQGIQGRSFLGVTSSTSVAIGTGSKTFTVSNTGAFQLGERVRAANTATPSNYVEGSITSITADTSITINADVFGGSGTFAAWTFSVAGIQGTQGPQGTTGSQGTTGTQGSTGTQGTTGLQGLQGTTGIQGTRGVADGTITFIIDGGGSVITTGLKGYLEIPFGCTITKWTVLNDVSGSITIDIWKDTYANYPPTVADTITGSAKPLTTTATKGQSSTLTGWTTSISSGDILAFNVDSVTSVTKATISLSVSKV